MRASGSIPVTRPAGTIRFLPKIQKPVSTTRHPAAGLVRRLVDLADGAVGRVHLEPRQVERRLRRRDPPRPRRSPRPRCLPSGTSRVRVRVPYPAPSGDKRPYDPTVRLEPAECGDRLSSVPVARLATVGADGAPHLVPITFARRRRRAGLRGRPQTQGDDGPGAAAEPARRPEGVASSPTATTTTGRRCGGSGPTARRAGARRRRARGRARRPGGPVPPVPRAPADRAGRVDRDPDGSPVGRPPTPPDCPIAPVRSPACSTWPRPTRSRCWPTSWPRSSRARSTTRCRPEWIAAPSQGMAPVAPASGSPASLGSSGPGSRPTASRPTSIVGFPGALRRGGPRRRPRRPATPTRGRSTGWSGPCSRSSTTTADDPRLAPRRHAARGRDPRTAGPVGSPTSSTATASTAPRCSAPGPRVSTSTAIGPPLAARRRAGNPTSGAWCGAAWAGPSPAELLPDLLAGRARRARSTLDLPPRLVLLRADHPARRAALPRPRPAVAAEREVHLLLFSPSPGHDRRGAGGARRRGPGRRNLPAGRRPVDRRRRPSAGAVVGPARAGGRLAPRGRRGSACDRADDRRCPRRRAPTTTLLARLQADLRAGRAPAGELVPARRRPLGRDPRRHGPARQVEVLRDAILHRLADDPTLREDEILVVCPALDTFAPLVEAVFGPPSDGRRRGRSPTPSVPAARVPDHRPLAARHERCCWRRSPGSSTSSADGSPLPPCSTSSRSRRCASASTSTTTTSTRSPAGSREAEVRWGLDGGHRGAWGIPGGYAVGSWRAVLDRLLVGVAVSDDDAFALGEVLPLGVEGSGVPVAGSPRRPARPPRRARRARSPSRVRRPNGARSSTAPPPSCSPAPDDAPWQSRRGVRGCCTASPTTRRARRRRAHARRRAAAARRARSAASPAGPTSSAVGSPCRPSHPCAGSRSGSCASSGWTTARSARRVPTATTSSRRHPRSATATPGPRPARRSSRRCSRRKTPSWSLEPAANVVTNQRVPPSVPLVELRDALLAAVRPDQRLAVGGRARGGTSAAAVRRPELRARAPPRRGAVELRSCRSGGRGGPRRRASPPRRRSWSDRCTARRREVLDLGDLHRMLEHPVRGFLRGCLGLHLPREVEATSDDLPTGLVAAGGVEGRRAPARHRAARRGRSTSGSGASAALGSLPAGALGDRDVATLTANVQQLVEAAHERGFVAGAATPLRGRRRARSRDTDRGHGAGRPGGPAGARPHHLQQVQAQAPRRARGWSSWRSSRRTRTAD